MTEEATITNHILVPKHEKLTAKEKEELLKKYGITQRELPKIHQTDTAIAHLDVEIGDVIKITRQSPTAGITFFYRGVSNE